MQIICLICIYFDYIYLQIRERICKVEPQYGTNGYPWEIGIIVMVMAIA